MKFKVEYIQIKRKASFLFARQIESSENFQVRDGSYLGPIELRSFLNQPRAIKPDGSPDMDVFAFYPKDKSKLKQISEGDILDLIY
jgi:hypothetical protein